MQRYARPLGNARCTTRKTKIFWWSSRKSLRLRKITCAKFLSAKTILRSGSRTTIDQRLLSATMSKFHSLALFYIFAYSDEVVKFRIPHIPQKTTTRWVFCLTRSTVTLLQTAEILRIYLIYIFVVLFPCRRKKM